jgi:hypothetical protein
MPLTALSNNEITCRGGRGAVPSYGRAARESGPRYSDGIADERIDDFRRPALQFL